ncbi:MAG TPA: hypothetical protein VGR35_03720 [Tepidisphaeraceae bacterium]|nr:hypothetical protein [Tepidisphaeraceae bacterium]
MNRSLVSLAALAACGLFIVSPAPAQQQGQDQQQESAIGAAAVRTRENAQTIELTQHQSPVIAVLYGQQPTDVRIVALLSNPEQPQQDKEIVFTRETANKRTVVYEGQTTGQASRIVLMARRGQEDAQVEKIAEQQGVMVYGVRKAEPKQQQQQAQQQGGQGQGQAQAQGQGQGQDAAAQQAAAQQDAAAAAQQAAAQQKAREEEAKRKAAEPKPDMFEAIVTVYMTTGR